MSAWVSAGCETVVSESVPPRARLIVAVLLGVVTGHAVLYLTPQFDHPRDMMQFWFAARAVLHGRNPYASIGPGRPFEYPWPLVYPLPSAVAVVPLSWLSATWACVVFAGFSSACLAWALMKHGYASLLAYGSLCLWHAVFLVQWSTLLSAALVIAPLGFFLVVKPTVGLAYFVARPTWWAVAGAVTLTALSFALDPGWVGQWQAALASALAMAKHGFPYRAPALMPGGLLVLAALTRWRRSEARLLVALACVPHTTLPYELLPLYFIPRGWIQTGSLVALSHLMWWLVSRDYPHPDFYYTVIEYTRTAIPCIYLPCTLMVMRRPNVGALPIWLERRVEHLPAWLRGAASDTVVPAVMQPLATR
jgi:hypothetical protein